MGCQLRAAQRKTLERLCRYITRPALANDRVQINAAGQVELIKCPWRDGTTHQVMSPLEFMQRLAALAPRPRLASDSLWWPHHFAARNERPLRFAHGVLAPMPKLRAKVVPRPREEPAQGAPSPEDTKAAHGRPRRRGVGEATEARV
jgi:Putative transposase